MGRYRYLVSGNVQKVRYRDYIAEHAERLDLLGEVKNRHGGRVEAIVEGKASDLTKFERIMKADMKRGSTSAELCLATDISYERIKERYMGAFSSFEIAYSNSYQEELNDQFGAAMKAQMMTNSSIQKMDEKLESIDGRFVGLDARLESIDGRFVGLDEKIGHMDESIQELTRSMDSNFDRLDQKYHKISQLLEALPERIACELGKVLKAGA